LPKAIKVRHRVVFVKSSSEAADKRNVMTS